MDEQTESDDPPKRFGLRERKAAMTRLSIVRVLQDKMRERRLAEITVEELAEEVGISRMTLFNYFASKDQALEFSFTVWLLRTASEIERRKLRGVPAIEAYFDLLGVFVDEAPHRAQQMIAWFASRPPGSWKLPEITPAELALIAPDTPLKKLPSSLGEWFLEQTAIARAEGSIRSPSTDYELAHLLGAIFSGGALIGHSTPNLRWQALFRHHVRRALNLDTNEVALVQRNTRKHSKRGKHESA